MTELISIFVPGHPRTKGSLKPVVDWARRKVHMEEQVSQSKPWRNTMQAAIVREIRSRERLGKWEPYADPVAVDAVFTYDRPATGVGVDLPYPVIESGKNANGDLDKLLRNLLDALQGSGLIKNDAQVCGIGALKMWGAQGVWFTVRALPTRVEFCSWCPDPERPDARAHPNGQAEHHAGARS